jgi:hypothetical protein
LKAMIAGEMNPAKRSRVRAVLATAPDGMSTTEIRAAAGLNGRNAADVLLSRMVQDGEIERVTRAHRRAAWYEPYLGDHLARPDAVHDQGEGRCQCRCLH